MPPSISPRIVIAGFGLLTPLGQSAWATFRALMGGRTLGERASQLPEEVAPVDLVRAVGAVKLAQHGADDPAVELAEHAAREAAFMAGVELHRLPTILGSGKGAVGEMLNVGCRMANVIGSMPHSDVPHPRSHIPHSTFDTRHPTCASPLGITLGPHGYLDHQLRGRLGINVISHHVAACASSLTALHFARMALSQPCPFPGNMPAKAGTPPYVLVLTAEASLLPLFIHSYRRLGVLAPATAATYRQYPMDERRGGFMLSEMAAAVMLRRLTPGAEPGPGEIELVDTAIAAEAYDMIRPNPRMEALDHVARQLLRRLDGPVDMIHPHAPGTSDHDPLELSVYSDALTPAKLASAGVEIQGGKAAPDLYANKGAIGHGLGASGLASLVLAAVCLTAGRRPPMPWLDKPIQELSDFKSQISNSKSEISDSRSQISDLRFQISDSRSQISDSKCQISDLRSQISDFKSARPCSRTGMHAVFAAGFGGHVAGAVIRRK